MYKRGGLCQLLIYCLHTPNWPFTDPLYIFSLPAGTIFVSEATGESLPEKGIFPPGSGVSWQAPAAASISPALQDIVSITTSSWTTFSWTTPENTFPASSRGLISRKIYWCYHGNLSTTWWNVGVPCLTRLNPSALGKGWGNSMSPLSQPWGGASEWQLLLSLLHSWEVFHFFLANPVLLQPPILPNSV